MLERVSTTEEMLWRFSSQIKHLTKQMGQVRLYSNFTMPGIVNFITGSSELKLQENGQDCPLELPLLISMKFI